MRKAGDSSFAKKDMQLSLLLKALSHPGRIAILKVLAQKNSCICGELVADLPLAQSTVSQHLKVLKDAELIIGEVEGPRSCYCLNTQTIQQLSELFGLFIATTLTQPQQADPDCC